MGALSLFAVLRVDVFFVKRTVILSRKRSRAGTWRILPLLRKFHFFQQERLHIGDDEARVERTRAVDISDATFAIDEKDAHG